MKMKNFFGILFLFTLLYSCETPVAYIPPADELKDGYKRYSCRFVNDWRNNDVKYYFFDINLDKKIGLFNYATFYEGKKPKWNTSHYFTYIDNQKAEKCLINVEPTFGPADPQKTCLYYYN